MSTVRLNWRNTDTGIIAMKIIAIPVIQKDLKTAICGLKKYCQYLPLLAVSLKTFSIAKTFVSFHDDVILGKI